MRLPLKADLQPSADTAWLSHAGEMAERIRALDWSRTPVGPMRDWPDALRIALNLMLPAQAQMVVFWGPELAAFYNDAYAPTIGRKHPHILGRPAREGWAELWDDLGPLLHAVLDRGETISAKDRPFQIDRQGFMEEVWFDISYSPIRAPSGRVEGVLCIVAETTQRVLGTRALQQREAQLRDVSERLNLALDGGAVLGTWMWNVQTDTFHADERFARTFALDAGSLSRGMRLEEVKQSIHPDDMAHVNDALSQVLARGGRYSAEYRVPRDGGGWRWVEASGHVELDAAGRALRFPGVLIDVDRRRQAEATLRLSEARFRALAQSLPNQVWTARPDGQLDWVNQRVVEYSGVPAESLEGLGLGPIMHPEDRAAAIEQWGRSVARGEPYEIEFRLRRADGAWRWHLVRALPIVFDDAGGTGWLGTNTDIDDHRAAQEVLRDMNAVLERRVVERSEELRVTQSRLHESQKMEALGQLTGGIAHDFNNMLQSITTAVEVMRRRAVTGHQDDVERYAERALNSARRAAGLVQRLLAFARRQSLDPKAVNVGAMVQSLGDLLRRTLGENIALSIQADGDARALCDENQLESSLLNLCINARDAMPRGGELAIGVANVTLDAAACAATGAEMPGDYVRIDVRDSGTGMEPHHLARAFEPFFTTKPAGQGTGLGLSMIYGFARQSGGAAQLHSVLGEGTTATLYLPRFRGEAAQHARAGEGGAAAAQHGDGRIVLVVEDDAAVRATLLESLRELGYRTLEAMDADSAMRLLATNDRVDILLSDVGLPGMNGRQLTEHAQKQRPGLPALLVTGYAPAAIDRGEFLGGGNVAMLAKPYTMEQLARALRDLAG